LTGHIDSHRIFVYGTLRKDSDHDMYRVLARSSIFVGDATVNGDLYNLDTYPGLVLSSDAHSIVYGEVYELKPVLAARVLAILDD
jgi:pyruvate carboxylase